MPRISTAKTRLTDAAMEMIWENSYGATSVDAICDKAGVKKGSFYYFFKSKSDLAAAALEADWSKHQAEFDLMFSPTVPPLDRLKHYLDFNYRKMAELQIKCGAVLGCALSSLGSEVCTQDTVLLQKVHELLDRKLTYLNRPFARPIPSDRLMRPMPMRKRNRCSYSSRAPSPRPASKTTWRCCAIFTRRRWTCSAGKKPSPTLNSLFFTQTIDD